MSANSLGISISLGNIAIVCNGTFEILIIPALKLMSFSLTFSPKDFFSSSPKINFETAFPDLPDRGVCFSISSICGDSRKKKILYILDFTRKAIIDIIESLS